MIQDFPRSRNCLAVAVRRLHTQAILEGLGRGALAGLAVGLVAALARIGHGGWISLWGPACGLLGAIAGGLYGFSRKPTLPEAGSVLDRLTGSKDRFATFEEFSRPGTRPSELAMLALADCEKFAGGIAPEEAIPRPLPRAFWILPVPAIGLLLLALLPSFDPTPRAEPVDPEQITQAQSVSEALKEAAGKETSTNPEMERLKEELRKSAEAIQSTSEPDKQRAMLKELSGLEELLTKMLTEQPAELQALANALRGASQEAADALERGDTAEAGRKLQDLLQDLQQRGDAEEAIRKLAESIGRESQKLSQEQKGEVARQMQEAAQQSQTNSEMQKALQELSELLQKQGQQGQQGSRNQQGGQQQQQQQQEGSQSAGRQRSLQEIKDLIERLKRGETPQPGQGGQSAQKDQPVPGLESMGATGKPGSEMDFGSDPNIDKGNTPREAPVGPLERPNGLAAQGETLIEKLPTADAGGMRASREYQQLYQTYAPAAAQAVRGEEVPPGSRAMVGRYFQSIQPQNK